MTNAAPVVSLDSFLPQLKLDALCVVLRHSIHQAAEAGENVKAAAEAAAEAFAAGLAAFEKAHGLSRSTDSEQAGGEASTHESTAELLRLILVELRKVTADQVFAGLSVRP